MTEQEFYKLYKRKEDKKNTETRRKIEEWHESKESNELKELTK